MSLLVDTSVWSLALRRDADSQVAEVEALREALAGSSLVVTTGLVLQELLQGTVPARARALIRERFALLTTIVPSEADHVRAADIRNTCRSHGVQVGTIDALLASLSIGHDLTLLTTDRDFTHAARHVPLRVWRTT
ncbi:MAG: PIN domain-containing protein [Actinomycetia bacterium]|nr:PIN domain-containing protein [Actinomycetes bacterium]